MNEFESSGIEGTNPQVPTSRSRLPRWLQSKRNQWIASSALVVAIIGSSVGDVQLFGHKHAEIAKRIDIADAAIFNQMSVDAMSELDLSYTPPLGSPWDAVQMGAQAWVRDKRSVGR